MKRREVNSLMVAASLAALTRTAHAEDWPSRPVRLIVSQAPGSGTDAMARMVAEQLTQIWKVPVIVDNKAGGQNSIGASFAARSAPDGYTLYFATLAALISNAYLFKSLSYDPIKDFTPVSLVCKVPFVLCVHPSAEAQTFSDLVSLSRASSGGVTIADEGPKSFSGMLTRLINAETDGRFNTVPYVSGNLGANATVAGQTQAVLCDLPSAIGSVKGGRLRVIATSTVHPVPTMEKVRPIADTIRGFDYAGWVGIVAPARTPLEVTRRVNKDINAILGQRDFAARIDSIGPVVTPSSSPDDMARFLADEHAQWSVLTKRIGVLPE